MCYFFLSLVLFFLEKYPEEEKEFFWSRCWTGLDRAVIIEEDSACSQRRERLLGLKKKLTVAQIFFLPAATTVDVISAEYREDTVSLCCECQSAKFISCSKIGTNVRLNFSLRYLDDIRSQSWWNDGDVVDRRIYCGMWWIVFFIPFLLVKERT